MYVYIILCMDIYIYFGHMEDDLVVTNQNSGFTNHNGFNISEINAYQPTTKFCRIGWRVNLQETPIHSNGTIPWFPDFAFNQSIEWCDFIACPDGASYADLLHLCMPYRYYIYICKCNVMWAASWPNLTEGQMLSENVTFFFGPHHS